MNAASTAIDALFAGLAASNGVSVVYTPTGLAAINLTAIPGVTDTEATAADGTVRTMRSHDFVVKISALGRTPERGDAITYDSRKYVVANINGRRHFDEVGPFKQLYRIHTKQIDAS